MSVMGPAGLAELWRLIKARFAAAAHTHAADDLPVATSSSPGIVKPDGSTVTVTNGILSAQAHASNIPLGTVIWSTSSANPGEGGMTGTWILRTSAFLTFSSDSTCFYLWEKVA